MADDGPDVAKVKALHLAASDIAAAGSRQEVFETAVETAADVLEFDVCGVFVARDGRLVPAAQTDAGPELQSYGDDEGILGETYQRSEPFLVEDAHRSDDAKPADRRFCSGVSIPLDGIGVVQAISATEGYYDESDLELAELLALHIEEAVSRIDSEADLRESKRKIERLHWIATSLESCTDQEGLVETAVEAADDILDFDWCLVARVRDDQFVVEGVSAGTPVSVGDVLFPDDAGVAGMVIDTGESMVVDDTRSHEVATPAREAFRSGLVVPLGEKGVFAAVSDEVAAFDEQDQELTELLAASVTEAYDRIEAQASLRQRQQELDLLKEMQSRVLRHNLRNDLNVVEGAAQSARDAPPERTAELLDTIERTARGLAETSEKVREIKRVVDRSDGTRSFRLPNAVEPVVESLGRQYPEATIRVDVPDIAVESHRELPVAVRNLVENGIVHNVGAATVEVHAAEQDGRAVLTICDDGPGIPDHETAAIRQNRETDLEHGSGAGLWLVSWVVQRSSGTLRFPKTDHGTTVTLELPVAD